MAAAVGGGIDGEGAAGLWFVFTDYRRIVYVVLAGAADGLGYASTEYRARYRSTVYVVLPRGCGLRGCGCNGCGDWWRCRWCGGGGDASTA